MSVSPRRSPFFASVFVAMAFGLPLAVGVGETLRAAHADEVALEVFRGAPEAGAPRFLWVTLVTALHRAGIDLAVLGRNLPILCFAGLLAVLVVHALRAPVGAAPQAFVPGAHRDWLLQAPVAAWGVSLHPFLQLHASNASEAALFALLAVGGLMLVVNHPRQNALGATVFGLATLSRPEGWMLSALALAYAGWRGGWPRAARFVAMWLALILPYCAWKFAAPDAAAQCDASAGGAAWGQGWAQASVSLRSNAVLVACAAIGVVGWIALARRRRDDPRYDLIRMAFLQILIVVPVVFARSSEHRITSGLFLATTLLYLVAEEAVRVTGRRALVTMLATVVIALTLVARL